MSLYNVVFTALTPLIVGTMDSDVNREMSRKYPGLNLTCSPLHFLHHDCYLMIIGLHKVDMLQGIKP